MEQKLNEKFPLQSSTVYHLSLLNFTRHQKKFVTNFIKKYSLALRGTHAFKILMDESFFFT